MRFFKTRVRLWPVLLVVFVVAIAVVGASLTAASNGFSLANPFGAATEEKDTQVIKFTTPEDDVVLVGLRIEGIDEKRQNGTFLGAVIPGSERAVFVRYGFDAKLGIDGAEVKIEPLGENRYRVTIPDFIFIGFDDPEYELAVETNGILSWTTPEIDTLGMVSDLVDDEAQAEYLKSERGGLEERAEDFYTSIISSVDPAATLEFKFDGSATNPN